MPFWGSRKRDPNDVALVTDVYGHCEKCRRHGSARLTAYYSGEILIRCNNCKTANQFTPDDDTWNDPRKFLPFRDDEDPGDEGQGRYSKGRR